MEKKSVEIAVRPAKYKSFPVVKTCRRKKNPHTHSLTILRSNSQSNRNGYIIEKSGIQTGNQRKAASVFNVQITQINQILVAI